jgi:hypothetical protein
MSSNLRNKNYVFKNKQYTREAYLGKMKDYELSSFIVREGLSKEFKDLLEQNAIHRYVISERNISCSGNMLFSSKNSKVCFDAVSLEDTKYIYSSLNLKNSMDIYHLGWSELAYEIHGCRGLYNSQFCHLCYENRGIQYCDSCQNGQNLFGCISIKNGEYMILNKKYNKTEYETLKERIIEHMKKMEEYGEFFPPSISPVCYNETQGNYYMPETKEIILSRGWLWEDKMPGTFNKETIDKNDIPDTIEETKNEILSAVFRCDICTKNYNIVPNELTFYHREKIPLPRHCPECRHKRRFAIRLPRKLWQGACMCNKEGHGHLGKCPTEFETCYAPGRPEKVYCENCYNKEVY